MGYGRRSELRDGVEEVFCSHCKRYKPVGEFLLRTPLLGLYQYYCKSCQAAIDKINNEKQLVQRGGRKNVRRQPESDNGYCSHCKQWKPKSEFNFWDTKKGILQYYCRDCQHEVEKKHYIAHPERVRETNKATRIKARDRAREYIRGVLKDAKCAECGIANPLVLTFHHVRGKKKDDIATMVAQGRPLDSIRDEISKTEILCFNCHMIHHHNKKSSYRSLWK